MQELNLSKMRRDTDYNTVDGLKDLSVNHDGAEVSDLKFGNMQSSWSGPTLIPGYDQANGKFYTKLAPSIATPGYGSRPDACAAMTIMGTYLRNQYRLYYGGGGPWRLANPKTIAGAADSWINPRFVSGFADGAAEKTSTKDEGKFDKYTNPYKIATRDFVAPNYDMPEYFNSNTPAEDRNNQGGINGYKGYKFKQYPMVCSTFASFVANGISFYHNGYYGTNPSLALSQQWDPLSRTTMGYFKGRPTYKNDYVDEDGMLHKAGTYVESAKLAGKLNDSSFYTGLGAGSFGASSLARYLYDKGQLCLMHPELYPSQLETVKRLNVGDIIFVTGKKSKLDKKVTSTWNDITHVAVVAGKLGNNSAKKLIIAHCTCPDNGANPTAKAPRKGCTSLFLQSLAETEWMDPNSSKQRKIVAKWTPPYDFGTTLTSWDSLTWCRTMCKAYYSVGKIAQSEGAGVEKKIVWNATSKYRGWCGARIVTIVPATTGTQNQTTILNGMYLKLKKVLWNHPTPGAEYYDMTIKLGSIFGPRTYFIPYGYDVEVIQKRNSTTDTGLNAFNVALQICVSDSQIYIPVTTPVTATGAGDGYHAPEVTVTGKAKSAGANSAGGAMLMSDDGDSGYEEGEIDWNVVPTVDGLYDEDIPDSAIQSDWANGPIISYFNDDGSLNMNPIDENGEPLDPISYDELDELLFEVYGMSDFGSDGDDEPEEDETAEEGVY